MDYLTLHPPRLYALPFFRSLLEDKIVWLQDVTEERWATVPNTKAVKCPHGVQVTHRDLYTYDDDEMRQHVKEQHEALAWTGALK